MNRRAWGSVALGSPWLVTFGLFWLFPVAYSLVVGFTDLRLLGQSYSFVGLDNFHRLISDEAFQSSVENTFVFVLGTIPLTTVIALALALLVNRQIPGRGLFRSAFFLPSITSMVVVALVFTNLYSPGGYIGGLADLVGVEMPRHGLLFDTGTALYAIMVMDVWMAVGYYMLIFLAGLKAIPEELYEVARMQGAGPIRQLFSITLPLLRPVALFVVVINSIKSFQIFIEIFVMTKGKFDTSTMVYFIYDTGLTTRFEIGYASAAAMVLFAVIAVFSLVQFLLFQRKQVQW